MAGWRWKLTCLTSPPLVEPWGEGWPCPWPEASASPAPGGSRVKVRTRGVCCACHAALRALLGRCHVTRSRMRQPMVARASCCMPHAPCGQANASRAGAPVMDRVGASVPTGGYCDPLSTIGVDGPLPSVFACSTNEGRGCSCCVLRGLRRSCAVCIGTCKFPVHFTCASAPRPAQACRQPCAQQRCSTPARCCPYARTRQCVPAPG